MKYKSFGNFINEAFSLKALRDQENEARDLYEIFLKAYKKADRKYFDRLLTINDKIKKMEDTYDEMVQSLIDKKDARTARKAGKLNDRIEASYEKLDEFRNSFEKIKVSLDNASIALKKAKADTEAAYLSNIGQE